METSVNLCIGKKTFLMDVSFIANDIISRLFILKSALKYKVQ